MLILSQILGLNQRCPKFTPESLSDVPVISGHFGYGYANKLMKDRISFTFLRDPVERVLSLFYF